MMCCPVTLAAQNGITISDFSTKVGSPTTLTFNIRWSPPQPEKVWSDTVWVFIDYNNKGTMTRLPLVPGAATLTAHSAPGVGKVIPVTGNPHGVWVVGNARAINGSFSANVQLLVETWRATSLHGLCIYAINYPPVGRYTAADKIKFNGTPPFYLTFSGGGAATVTRDAAKEPYTIPEEQTLASFTDASLAPGVTKCKEPIMQTFTASAAGYCEGDAGVQLALGSTELGAVYQLYKDASSLGGAATLTGAGGAATFSGHYTAGNYAVRVVETAAFCPLAMNGTRTVTENAKPTAPKIAPPANVCLNGGSLTFVASAYTGALTWTATGGGAVNGNTVTISGTATGTKSVKARSAQTYTGAPICYSAEVTESATVNPLPTVSGATGTSRCSAGTLTLLAATNSTDAVIDWYSTPAGGASLTTSNSHTPNVGATTVYYAQARNTSTQCVSSARTPATATVNPLPDTPNITASAGTVCQNAPLTFYVSNPKPSNATYTWVNPSAGTVSTPGNGSSYTFNTADAGSKSATVNVLVNAGGTVCRSANAQPQSATVVAPSGSGVAPNACGCATDLIPVDGKCQLLQWTTVTGQSYSAYLQMTNDIAPWNTDAACLAACQKVGGRLPSGNELCAAIGDWVFYVVPGRNCGSGRSYRHACDRDTDCYEAGQPCYCVK